MADRTAAAGGPSLRLSIAVTLVAAIGFVVLAWLVVPLSWLPG